jgi:formate hydrogenlyase transcriptional activator
MSSSYPESAGNQSWTYDTVASQPPPPVIEDLLLIGLRKLTSTLDVRAVCEAVLNGVANAFGASSSWIMLHDPGPNVLRTALCRGRGADVYANAEIPADAGIAGLAFTRGEIEFVADVAKEDRWFNLDGVRASGLRSVLVLPLIARQRKMGVLGVDVPEFGAAHAPTTLEVKRLEIFCAQAAMGLLNAHLYQASQQDRRRLRALCRERRSLRRQVLILRDEVREACSFGPIVGESTPIRDALVELEQVAKSDVTVLLLGETGTGKELLARALHERSSRSPRPFIPVNCAALPENLVESELFGHERGAFTGAHTRKPGRFELAHRGTLFLDEIGDLPLNAQAKLLRVLQDGDVYRVGSTQPARVDVRLVAATNHDLPALVGERLFREDLFYRVSVFPIRVPPLRERQDDIPLLARHLTARCARRVGKRITEIEQEALDVLTSYPWPGNVRELENVIERAVILSAGGVITTETIRLDRLHVPAEPISVASPPTPTASASPQVRPAPLSLADVERNAIVDAVRRAEGRISGPGGAASLLGLKPTTLHAKMKKLGVRRGDALKR